MTTSMPSVNVLCLFTEHHTIKTTKLVFTLEENCTGPSGGGIRVRVKPQTRFRVIMLHLVCQGWQCFL